MQLIHTEVVNGKRINAIKILKSATGCSLREAKHGVDNIGHSMGKSSATLEDAPVYNGSILFRQNNETQVKLIPTITKVGLAIGEGEAMVDIETASLQILSELGTIPLAHLQRAMKLLELLNDFNEGKINNANVSNT